VPHNTERKVRSNRTTRPKLSLQKVDPSAGKLPKWTLPLESYQKRRFGFCFTSS